MSDVFGLFRKDLNQGTMALGQGNIGRQKPMDDREGCLSFYGLQPE
jgi:hypothetical protein